MLMYPYGAQSVKCAVCQFVTPTGVNNMRMPLPVQRTTSNASSSQPPATQQVISNPQTVVVENPMTLDESGKLVSNVAVGVTTERK
ncbi:hypothetical protein KP509_07G086700 [Ceratopteris richardii]|nr:hypothetical protein KP509_07G086700 [Ceratopteris richardii]